MMIWVALAFTTGTLLTLSVEDEGVMTGAFTWASPSSTCAEEGVGYGEKVPQLFVTTHLNYPNETMPRCTSSKTLSPGKKNAVLSTTQEHLSPEPYS